MGFLEIIALIVFIVVALAGLLLTPIGLPGTFLIVVGAVFYNIIMWSWVLSFKVLAIILGLAIFGEILEYYLAVKAAKKHGASKAGVGGALIGGIVGAIVGVPVFLIGSLIGLFVGAFLGAFIVEFFRQEDVVKAAHAGLGAFYGRLGAIMVKSLIGVVMVVVVVSSIF